MIEHLLRRWLLLLFLLILLAIPFVQWMWPVTETNENRLLATMPGSPRTSEQLAQFPKAFERYMDDNFGFRRFLQRSYHRIIIATGSSPLDNILLGKDGWLFTAYMDLTHQNRGAMMFSPEELDRYANAFSQQRRWVESRGADYFLMPIPDKNTLYPEFLPDHARQVRQSRFAQVQQVLGEQGEPFIDVLSKLEEARARGEWIYWQTDTHWNCLGAFHAYDKLMDAVDSSAAPYRKRVLPSALALEARPPSVGGDMSQMLLMEDILLEHRDVGCGLVLSDDVGFSGERLSDGFVRNNHIEPQQNEVWRYRQDVPSIESKALVFRDSYAHLLLPYLIKTFDEVVVVPHGELNFDDQHFLAHEPDVVIYQFVERHLLHEPDRAHLVSNQF